MSVSYRNELAPDNARSSKRFPLGE
jgi:hypothetical protein